jgi:RNA polymerase sigma-70 factor (ECF subfamily)
MDHSNAAHEAAEAVARDCYGRLVAYLSARSRDLAAAEDALGEAFRAALEVWPRDGVPKKPEVWLLTVARRQMIDEARHYRVQAEAAPALRLAAQRKAAEADTARTGDGVFPDDRLKLMFVCAHPAIDAGARTPLMLQTVLGLEAARIASAFLVAPAAMSQRLVRAKAKIRDAGIPFDVPGPPELSARLGPVLDAVYAAYGTGWDDAAGIDPRRRGLATEAIWLARILAHFMPQEAEARGLLALLLYCESRRAARRGSSGEYVPLAEQNVALWSRPMIQEAEGELRATAPLRNVGRFQLEAAIQSVHAQRLFTGETNWQVIVLFYEELVRISPTLGAMVGRAAALANACDAKSGLVALDAIDSRAVLDYQPYWAVRAHVQAVLGAIDQAKDAYTRAVGLSEDQPVREFLIRARDRLGLGPPSAGPPHHGSLVSTNTSPSPWS